MGSIHDAIDQSDLEDHVRGANQKKNRKKKILDILQNVKERDIVWYFMEKYLIGCGYCVIDLYVRPEGDQTDAKKDKAEFHQ